MPADAETDEYQSLYRRFRPQTFAELRGQEHVALALRHAVRDERVSHAYLFSGPRGTGKTSTARILAKALNCAALREGEPCGECDSCRAITRGNSYDVHELDAASNNGVDAMRDLVARASLATPGRWKVYIVDEVHMLSTAASNALLKTLEEPPSHVVFVLATTDPHKVLPTIRSRTQHFEFRLLSEETLATLLAEVAEAAHLVLPDGGVTAAVRRGKGSARDALSVLDQVAAAGIVEEQEDHLERVIAALGDYDSEAAIVTIDRALQAGHDPQQLAVELVELLRAGFLSLAGGGTGQQISAPQLQLARALGLARSVRALEAIGGALVAMRDAPEPRVTLEVALIRLCHPEADSSLDAIRERLERLERRVAATSVGAPPLPPIVHAPAAHAAAATTPVADEPAPAPEAEVAPTVTVAQGSPRPSTRPALGAFSRRASPGPVSAPSADIGADESGAPLGGAPDPVTVPVAAPPSRDELVLAWGDHIIQQLRPKVRAIFNSGHFVGVEGGGALLALPNEAHLAYAQPLLGEVAEALGRHFGRPVPVLLVTDDAPHGATTAPPPEVPTPPREALPGTEIAPTTPVASLTNGDGDDEMAEEDGTTTDEGALGIAMAKDRLLEAFPGAEEVERR